MTDSALAPPTLPTVTWTAPRKAGVAAAVLVAVGLACRRVDTFPATFDSWISRPFDSLYAWIRRHERTSPLFTRLVAPVSDALGAAIEWLGDELAALPWYGVALLAALLVVARTGRWAMAATAAAAGVLPGLFGLWDATTTTLALMLVAVGCSVLLGVPIGVTAARSGRFERVLRPVLDTMQTIPTPAFLVPAVVVFSIGQVPAVVATVIYALPPIVRLTVLGIRGVPAETVEAGEMFGASRLQVLVKVQLPQAVPAIATGVNQTINMALGIIVIAAFVGAGGLGQEALEMLRQRRTGRGLVVGLCVVCVAVLLDRISRSFIERRDRGAAASVRGRSVAAIVACLGAVVVGRVAGWDAFPVDVGRNWLGWIDTALDWVRDHGRAQLAWLNDTYVRSVYVRARGWVTGAVPWPVWVLLAALVGRAVRGWRLALFAAGAVFAIGATGLWVPAGETFVQVLTGVVVAAVVAIPLGVWAGLHRRVETAMSPLLDGLQTVPALTYALPFVSIFAVGVVPGICASVLYALAPGVRVTALGIKQVPAVTVEAATTFGATNRQLLWGVRLPLALPSIMVAVNQVILMVVAMVIIAGMTGGGGLGYRMVEAFQRQYIGQGVEVALCLSLMGMVLDRLTQGLAERFRPVAR